MRGVINYTPSAKSVRMAEDMQRLHDVRGKTWDDISEFYGFTRTYVLSLCRKVKEMKADGIIPYDTSAPLSLPTNKR